MLKRQSPSLAPLYWNGQCVPESAKMSVPFEMRVTSALTFKQATTPHNTQVTNSCAFVGPLSCAQRHRLLPQSGPRRKTNPLRSGHPAKSIVDAFKVDVPSGMKMEKGVMVGADPFAFTDYLFEKVGRNTCEAQDYVTLGLKQAEQRPCVLSFLPVQQRGRCVVYSKEDFVKEFHDKYQLPEEKRVWHTQCVVGASECTATKERYFVCLQSWPNSVLTFIPAMSTTEIIQFSKLPANKENKRALSIPTMQELHLQTHYELLVPAFLKYEHAPSQTEFTANKMNGMLLPPVHTGYLPKGVFM